MKLTIRCLSLLLLISVKSVSTAQDFILDKNGREEKVRILGMNERKIEFRNYRQPSFDHRTFGYKKVNALAIKYENGSIVNGHGLPITNENYDYIKHNALSKTYFKKGIPALCFAGTFVIAGISLLGYGLNAKRELGKNPEWDQRSANYLIISGACTIIPAIPLGIVGSVLTFRGVKSRKKADALKPSVSFSPLIGPNIDYSGQAVNFKTGLTTTFIF
ncbi:MAG: hypothetical protein V4615_10360 [Bacteroidota bacterium]